MPSTWIPAAELTAQRTAAELTLNDTCVISRLTNTADGQGGFSQTWAAFGTCNGRIVANSGNTKQIAGQFEQVGAYTLTVPYNTDLDEQDKVTIDAVVYRVVAVDAVRDWKTTIRAQLNLEIT